MGMTLTEKILARAAGRDLLKPGEIVSCELDLVMAHEATGPLAIEVMKEMGAKTVWDPNKVALVNDHFVPAKDIEAAELSKSIRRFAREAGIEHYFEIGRSGVCHALLPEKGLVCPGDVIVGADSHSCTYGALGAFATGLGSTDLAGALALGRTWFRVPESIKVEYEGTLGPWIMGKDLVLRLIGDIGVDGARYKALEIGGEALKKLRVSDRLTIANMAIEAGAKNGVMEADEVTLEYVNERCSKEPRVFKADSDAGYSKRVTVNLDGMGPQVAAPYSPGNVSPVEEYDDVRVDQVVVGSCTNGRIEDFRVAARVLGDQKVHPDVRFLCVPATMEVFIQMAKEGLAEHFASAGAVVSAPTCGPCLGGHMGVLGVDEVAVYTTNRNFPGRAGHKSCQVYLASPAVAAATAVTGRITHPSDVADEAIWDGAAEAA